MKTKEQVYDEQINPLMAQIIAICKEHKIANLCTFSLDEDLACTTLNIEDDTDPPETIIECSRIIFPPRPRQTLMMTVEKSDGSKTITAIL
jgi:hypothetical protein